MSVKLNSNQEIVKSIKEKKKKNGEYSQKKKKKTEENKCMCKEFREQIKDPNFEGYCHCMLYYKTID